MSWSKGEVEKLLDALVDAILKTRGIIGHVEIKGIKLRKSSIEVYCELSKRGEKKRLIVKYSRDRVWIEGPTSQALKLKRELVRELKRRGMGVEG